MASKSSNDKGGTDETEGESSSKQSELQPKGQLQKSESKKMREQAIRKDLSSTRALVAAYNQAEADEESEALHQWLQRYSPYLDAGFAKHAESGIFDEMAHLAGIRPRCEKDKDLITKTIRFLGQQVTDLSLDQRKTVAALAAALQAVDEDVFDGDAASLMHVCNVLLSKLDADQTPFIGATYNTHSITLFALHQALLVVQRITGPVINVRQKQQWFETLKTKLRSIAECQSHFPFLFQVKIVEQCLERLVINAPRSLSDVSRQVMSVIAGCCYIYSFGRKILTANIDLDSLKTGCERLKEAIANQESQREWYDEFLKLNGAAVLSSEKVNFDEDFMPCFQEVLEAQANLSGRTDADLLRFGIVTQLSYAVMHGSSPGFCKSAMVELVHLATRHLTYEGWDSQPAIIDAILEGLQDTHLSSVHEEMSETAVLCMTSCDSQTVRETTELWLNGQTIEDKLRAHARRSEKSTDCHYLFKIVRTTGGLYSHEEKVGMAEELRSKYKLPDFSKIPGLVEDQPKKDVTDLMFHIVFDEHVTIKDDVERRKPTLGENQILENYKRGQRVRKTIALEDLFNDRSIQPGQPSEEIHKVLLHGNPGTGKTTLGKRIANGWAEGLWGKRFHVLYLLYVRDLNKETYKNSAYIREQPTLECAIATLLFTTRLEEKEFKTLTKQIHDDLDHTTTLLVLDGLDEGDDIGYKMIHQAIHKECSLLLLTRPYNLQEIRECMQVEMECVGLNDEQLQAFLESELPNPTAVKLMEYLQQNPSIWQLAHIPVTANVLCLLWKGKERDNDENRGSDATIFELYEHMADFMWDRFQKKFPKNTVTRKDVYSSLQEIAFHSLRKGEIQISVALIKRHCSKNVSNELLKQSGFFLLDKEGTSFQFIHLTFQEFFTSLALANMFDSKDSKASQAEEYFSRNKLKDNFVVTLTFVSQSMCLKHGYNGFKLLTNITARDQGESDARKLIFVKLRILDAFVCFTEKEADVTFPSGDSIIVGIVEEAVSTFYDLRNIETDDSFDDEHETLIRVTESIPKTMQRFSELWSTLFEGYRSKSRKCARAMLVAATKIVKLSISYSEDLLSRLEKQLAGGTHKINVLSALGDVAREMPDRHDAILKLAEAALADDDKDVRLAMVGQLDPLAKAMPDRHDAILKLAEVASADDDKDVRWESVGWVANFAETIPDRHDAILKLVDVASADDDKEVRVEAVVRLHLLAQAMPDRHDPILKLAEIASADDDKEVRVEAVGRLHLLAQAMPDRHDPILKLAEIASADDDKEVRREAVRWLNKLAQAMPDRHDAILKLAEVASADDDKDVRWESVEWLANFAETMPDRHDAILKLAEIASADDDKEVRVEAVGRLHLLAQMMPDRHDPILKLAEIASADDDKDVRWEAVGWLNKLAQAMPGRHDAILKLAEVASADDDKDVRWEAVRRLDLLAHAMPDRHDAILKLVDVASADDDKDVRWETVRQRNLLAHAMPDRRDAILKLAEAASADDDKDVRSEGAEQLDLRAL